MRLSIELDAIGTDLRHALRGLRHSPGFAAAAILVFALGIGVNLAVFTIVNGTLFKGFRGIPAQDRLVYVTAGRGCCLSFQDLEDWRAELTSVTALGAAADLRVALEADSGVETATATEITANTFAILAVSPSLGRDFTTADDAPGASKVTIIADRLWRGRFAADPGVLGRVIRVNGTPTTVVGVMPPEFNFPQRQDLWLPLGSRLTGQPRSARGLWFAVGRLADDATIDTARAEIGTIGARLAASYPETNRTTQPSVQSFSEFFIGPDAVGTYGAVWGAVWLLLAIACANLVNLLLSHSAGRTREMGVRLALGAGRWRVVRQQLVASLLLSSAGGVAGWVLAAALVRGYETMAVAPTQPWASNLVDYSIDGNAGLYLIALSALAGLAVGVIPALRLSSLDVNGALRDGGRGTIGGRDRRRTTAVVMGAQVMLAVILLSASGVLARSYIAVASRNPGFDASRVLATLITLPTATYPGRDARIAFFDRLTTDVAALPGVEDVALVNGLPGQGGGSVSVEFEGATTASGPNQPAVRSVTIGSRYFETLGAGLVAGRGFDDRDHESAPGVAIVNRRLARLHWQTDDVVGRRLRLASADAPGPWLTVVGVAPDVHHGSLATADPGATVYLAMRQRPLTGAWVLVRTAMPPSSLAGAVRSQVAAIDSGLPIWLGPYELRYWLASTFWPRAVQGGLFLLFAIMALVLAALGLFAVVASTVAERRQEIGVRMALGATASNVRWLAIRHGLTPAVVGLAAGLMVSVATNALLANQLVDVTAWDPATLTTVAVTMILTALTGCAIPAARAARVDPRRAIRAD